MCWLLAPACANCEMLFHVFLFVCVCVCVRACVRARAHMCRSVCMHVHEYVYVCGSLHCMNEIVTLLNLTLLIITFIHG